MKSPAPVLPQDTITADLGEIRMRESQTAMELLGVDKANLQFLRLPEAELRRHVDLLRIGLLRTIAAIDPEIVLLPFRYDRHPDHLAINHVLTEACSAGLVRAQLVEYFVYYRWRLLPGRDVRQYIRPDCLVSIDTNPVAALKRRALDVFQSQTTIFYPWQTRPILLSQLLDDVSQTPELFLPYDRAQPGSAVFSRSVSWIRFVHRVEPHLQKWKYLFGSSMKRSLGER